jgi:hypothetical protein
MCTRQVRIASVMVGLGTVPETERLISRRDYLLEHFKRRRFWLETWDHCQAIIVRYEVMLTFVFYALFVSLLLLLYLAIQDLLINPNPQSPAQREAYELYVKNRPEYIRRVKQQAIANRPDV